MMASWNALAIFLLRLSVSVKAEGICMKRDSEDSQSSCMVRTGAKAGRYSLKGAAVPERSLLYHHICHQWIVICMNTPIAVHHGVLEVEARSATTRTIEDEVSVACSVQWLDLCIPT